MADEATTSKETAKKESEDSSKSSDSKSSSNNRSSSRGSRQNTRSQRSRSSYHNRRRYSRRKVCAFCADKNLTIDWKRVDGLRRYVADNGAIQPRRKSGLCAKHQRRVAIAIKRARHLALLPYTTEHVRIMGKNY